jgi:hypothetical protein
LNFKEGSLIQYLDLVTAMRLVFLENDRYVRLLVLRACVTASDDRSEDLHVSDFPPPIGSDNIQTAKRYFGENLEVTLAIIYS